LELQKQEDFGLGYGGFSFLFFFRDGEGQEGSVKVVVLRKGHLLVIPLLFKGKNIQKLGTFYALM